MTSDLTTHFMPLCKNKLQIQTLRLSHILLTPSLPTPQGFVLEAWEERGCRPPGPHYAPGRRVLVPTGWCSGRAEGSDHRGVTTSVITEAPEGEVTMDAEGTMSPWHWIQSIASLPPNLQWLSANYKTQILLIAFKAVGNEYLAFPGLIFYGVSRGSKQNYSTIHLLA